MALGFVLPGASSGGDELFRYLLWAQGGYSMLNGTLQLAWVPARERLSRSYLQLPRTTAADRRARVRAGEAMLDEMASDGARRRVVMAVAGSVFALVTPTIIYRDQIFNGEPMPEPAALNYLVLGLSAVSFVTELLGAFGTSDEERIRNTYRTQLELQRQQQAEVGD
jgi:hypothetical protein